MLLTESGIVKEVKPLHFEKANFPMVVVVLGRVMDDKFGQL